MPIFGDNTSGSGQFPMSGDRCIVDRFTLTEDGTVVSGHAYSTAATTSGSNWKFVILSDSAGLPGNVLWTSAPTAIPAGAAWHTFTGGTPPALTAGDYWLGVVADNFQGYIAEDDPGGTAPDIQMANGTYSYATPPAAWPGSSASYGVGLNVYVTYDVPASTLDAPLGMFDPELVPAAWVAPEQVPIGWWSASLIDEGGPAVYTVTGDGGLLLSGAATLARSLTVLPAGGFALAGAATLARSLTVLPAGGVSFSGAAAAVLARTFEAVGAGGLTLAGSGTVLRAFNSTASGGFTLSGVATVARVDVWEQLPSGGFTLAGAATLARTRAPGVSGGLTLAGSGAIARAIVPEVSGGFTLDGAATLARTVTAVPAGGVLLAGAAAAQYVSGANNVYTVEGAGGLLLAGAGSAVYVPFQVQTETRGGGVYRRGDRRPSFTYLERRSQTFQQVGAGGLVFRGSATVVFARRQYSIPLAVLAAI